MHDPRKKPPRPVSPTRPRRVTRLSAVTQRRALGLLASAGRNGVTGTPLAAHGFSAAMIVGLIGRGLATMAQEGQGRRQTRRSREGANYGCGARRARGRRLGLTRRSPPGTKPAAPSLVHPRPRQQRWAGAAGPKNPRPKIENPRPRPPPKILELRGSGAPLPSLKLASATYFTI
jgi:hypothetical protein